MMIECDVIIAHFKKQDWLKPIADRIFSEIKSKRIQVEVSTEVFHEVFYVLSEFTSISKILSNFAYLLGLENIKFLSPTPEVYVTALHLMQQYNIKSIFDAIYAAQALLQSKDKIIISTENIYDRIPGIKRIDPRDFITMI